MYDFRIEAADKAQLYGELIEAADALTAGEVDAIANMANVAALLWEALPDLNWAGFYRNVGGELVLGPFQGRPACIRIPFGGRLRRAAATGRSAGGRRRLSRPYRLRRRLALGAGGAGRGRRRSHCRP
jgi:GAF domain-containing protein